MGHQFLARAAFAPDQNGGIRGRDLFQKSKHLPHARTLTNHVVLKTNLSMQTLILTLEPLQVLDVLNSNARDDANSRQ